MNTGVPAVDAGKVIVIYLPASPVTKYHAYLGNGFHRLTSGLLHSAPHAGAFLAQGLVRTERRLLSQPLRLSLVDDRDYGRYHSRKEEAERIIGGRSGMDRYIRCFLASRAHA